MIEETNGEVLTDKCAIHFFELKKVKKKPDANNRMELWLQFVNAETEEELEMLNQTGVPEIKKAVMIIHEMSEDEKIQEIARLREKAHHDEASALKEAKLEGVEEGVQLGFQKGLNTLIEKLKKSGMTDEEIDRIQKID